MNILVTGGAGFIGSHVLRRLVTGYPGYNIFNLDALTYAGNLQNIHDLDVFENYSFLNADIRDRDQVQYLFDEHRFDRVIHLAAESHVDRSIEDPTIFMETNIKGTLHLLEAANSIWSGNREGKLFYHISTDEVYGSLDAEGYFTESTPYAPNSPYAASKAGSDHFVRAYGSTYGMPYVISNCSNNYGPNQFPEKLIPLIINNILENKPLPVYGDGNYTRDWLYVKDHVEAIDLILHTSSPGQTYNIGGNNEWKNIDLVRLICELMDNSLGRETGSSAKLITFVKDRPGHDLRYAIDASKIRNDLGWQPRVSFEDGLQKTIHWYLENMDWVRNVQTGAYLELNKRTDNTAKKNNK